MASRTAPSLIRNLSSPAIRRLSTTPKLPAASPLPSYDSTQVNRTTSIFPDRGANRGSNETRPLSQRIFGAPKGAALSETVEASEGSGPANWVGMKRQQVGFLEEGRLGWYVTPEERNKAAMEGMLAGLQAGIAAGGARSAESSGASGVSQNSINTERITVVPNA